VFVYDGNAGGAGFAERGFAVAAAWLRATAEAILSCECQAGCPSCVQSPKCGTGNDPLAKDGALVLLETLLAGAPATAAGPGRPDEVLPGNGASGNGARGRADRVAGGRARAEPVGAHSSLGSAHRPRPPAA